MLTYAGLKSRVLSQMHDDSTAGLYAAATEICDQTQWLLTDDGENMGDTDSDVSSSDDEDTDGLREVADKVKTYTSCLMDLTVALKCPALEPEHDDKPVQLRLEQRSAHDYHTELMRAKFPQSEEDLLHSLGETSWNRYQRMQHEREMNASDAAYSKFRDSGVGTSLPGGASTYTEPIVPFMTSVPGDKRSNIPPLSTEAKSGARFDCNACGKSIRATNNRDWR